MDEKARKFFHKEYSELTDYERMMLDVMAEKELADEPPQPTEEETSAVEDTPEAEEEGNSPAAPADEAPSEEPPLEAHRAVPVEEADVAPQTEGIVPARVEEPAAEDVPAPIDPPADPTEADDSDVKIAGDRPSETASERIPLLVEEKNPELEPVVVNRPTIQFMNSIEREKKITRKVRAQRRRSGIVVVALCAALILVAFMYNGIVNQSWGILEKEAPTPEVTDLPPEVHETPEPTATPEPTPEPIREHRVVLERADVSWAVAQDRCQASGGYLAVINSLDEFNKITAQAEQQGIECLWLGCRRDVTSNTFVWVTDEEIDENVDPNSRQMSLWGEGEPSFIDDNGVAENYLLLWNHDGRWSYWDSIDDLAGNYPGWRGRVAYACELED